ncbi:RNA-directed DNA polymerase, eukaryota [Tanacetum coccineum]
MSSSSSFSPSNRRIYTKEEILAMTHWGIKLVPLVFVPPLVLVPHLVFVPPLTDVVVVVWTPPMTLAVLVLCNAPKDLVWFLGGRLEFSIPPSPITTFHHLIALLLSVSSSPALVWDVSCVCERDLLYMVSTSGEDMVNMLGYDAKVMGHHSQEVRMIPLMEKSVSPFHIKSWATDKREWVKELKLSTMGIQIFDFVCTSDSLGNSGGILLYLEASIFKKVALLFLCTVFDRFIVSSGLVDVKLEGYSFTWSHPSASKMSKLDRFLVTEGIISLYPSISALCLDRHLSDHRPILLREVSSDFGPTPFRFYQSWLRMEGFDSMVDFAKAYDSVRWDYLLDILQAFGFGPNWCRWIRGTFTSSMASILVNGSPTSEFPLCCGLKQGDPLAPYLFILIMESLHISFSRVVDDGLFKGFQLHGSVNISHLFYADDAMFIGEWSEQNLHNIVKVLNCFHLASGLKINIAKSQVLGVGVSQNVVLQAANRIGCAVLNTPFRYLGVTVGECMSRKSAWVGLVNKLQARLSKWKVKTLSIGGRLTLLKSVLGASPIYYMSIFKVPKGVLKTMESIRSKFFNGVDSSDRKISWVAWDNVLASKLNGGLGVSSFFALNRALLLKWVWRFISGDGSLWCKVIQAIYGSKFDLHVTDQPSIWCSILREVKSLKDSGFDFSSHFSPVCLLSNWIRRLAYDSFGGISLDIPSSVRAANRMGCAFEHSFFVILGVTVGESVWSSEVGLGWLGEQTPSPFFETRWVKFIPIKVNVFSWRARRDWLPTRVNLSRRGVLLDSHLCPLCNAAMEDVQHVFFRCDMARVVLRKICRWWDLDWQEICSFSDWDAWFLSFRLSSRLNVSQCNL